MMDFLFFVKTFCLTVAIVLVMQIQVGEKSMENHAMGWMQSSAIVSPLNMAAKGAAKMTRDLTQYVSARVKSNTKKNKTKDLEKRS